ncbi:endothelin-converting enzyme homolog isoform X1 [Hydra vulgaris]|uniref:endothelin-converting enzyme homolog isoform X1 n=1 Tax=Hydra vulgaris TaxID=6087 RepID=UPI001F5FF011|nr:endothelin-converting enzyme homolog [Hydra vulgaris]
MILSQKVVLLYLWEILIIYTVYLFCLTIQEPDNLLQLDGSNDMLFTALPNDLTNIRSENNSVSKSWHSKNKNRKVCDSPHCLNISLTIKASLNESEDPCNDFYNFACGGWKASHEIPSSENEITAFTILNQQIEDELHDLLSADPIKKENNALKKARLFYKSCMNIQTIEELGPKPALDFINYLGGWSLCTNPDWQTTYAEKWDAYEVLKKLQRNFFPAPPFFTVDVTNDHLNSTQHLIKIDQSGLSLQREIYFKHSNVITDYGEYMVKVAKSLGYTCNDTDPERNITAQMFSILEFEKELAEITTPAEAKQAGTFRRINLAIMEDVVSEFNWKDHLQDLFYSVHILPDEVVLATSPNYLKKVANLIKKTDKRLLSRYMMWQMLRDKISFLSDDFRKARAEFNQKMTGVEDTEPRWRKCISMTNENMGIPIGALYIEKYFSESTKTKTNDMIDEIVEAFKSRIDNHDWIDGKTRKGVIQKVDALVAKVGYASYIKKPLELNKRFRKLKIDEDKFFENNLNVDKWLRYRLYDKLRKPVDKTKWPMFPQTINAMYQFYENEIVIPAGILQPPFFYTGDVPRSLSYGAIGSIIGHELTHGFDNTGRKFDKNGNIVKNWWSENSLEEFMERSKCFVDQYSNYKVQDKYNISGKLTLGENIADNGGVKISFQAYEDYLAHREDKVLPNLPFNNRQLFFIGYAQEYCSNVRERTEYIATLSEIHSPAKFRVIGSLSNSKEFASVFRCEKNAAMNPENKCVVW